MDGRRYIDTTERYISDIGAAAMPRQRIPPRSVMVSCIGWQLGKVAITTRDSFTNQQLNTIIPHDDWVDAGFLYYHLYTRRDEIKQLASGGTRTPILNKTRFEALPLLLPPKQEQIRISTALDCIDSLIENNRRRIELLQVTIRAIYREWFVSLRFPGHREVGLVDSPLGRVPADWTWSTCSDQLHFIGGGTPSKEVPAYWDGGTVAWYTPSDLTRNRWRYAAEPELCITEVGVTKSSARRFPAGSVMMTSRATLGVLAIATTEATTNQGFIVVQPDDRWSSGFMREWLDVKASELAAIATGATFKEITKGAFKRVPFLLPSQNVLSAYTAATDPVDEQILCLERQIRSLSTLRDLLIPKLITGKMAVSGLDVDALIEGGVA
jgi:type I restriction enzyme S subunit